MKILITGGAGFIGSAVIRYLITETNVSVLNIDKLTYAGNLDSVALVSADERYRFKKVDICDQQEIIKVFDDYQPDKVMHLAAESHVDRSIDSPSSFIQTNIVGTYNLLEISRRYWHKLDASKKRQFIFHHISTDEVFGDLEKEEEPFTETSAYMPSSPYSASKASSDHLVRSWHRTFGLPIVISNCSNNYGPFQHPEKFIPLTIKNALQGRDIPIYGNGKQIRDWLYVDDHAGALFLIINEGKIGSSYNLGGNSEFRNIDVVNKVLDILEERHPNKIKELSSYKDLIKFIKDRPGHDKRYAIDSSKIKNELRWSPQETFESGLRKTVDWHLKSFKLEV